MAVGKKESECLLLVCACLCLHFSVNISYFSYSNALLRKTFGQWKKENATAANMKVLRVNFLRAK